MGLPREAVKFIFQQNLCINNKLGRILKNINTTLTDISISQRCESSIHFMNYIYTKKNCDTKPRSPYPVYSDAVKMREKFACPDRLNQRTAILEFQRNVA